VQNGRAIKVKIANGQEVLPLAGCDIVLGIQWLRVLGPILWDFQQLTMKFQYGHADCMLQGLLQGLQLSLEDAASFKFSNKRPPTIGEYRCNYQ